MVMQRHGYDRYVTGGVVWEKYTLEQLIKMVQESASAPELQQLAQEWREAGDQVSAAAGVLGAALGQLMEFWAGTAAEQARQDVELNARWVADLGETAHDIGPSIEEAANALKAAQAAMPEIPADPAVPPALAADSAARGLDAGGPLVSAVTGTAAGTESAFAADQKAAELKARAVEAMRRFEGAVIGIDQSTPRFAEPVSDSGPGITEPTPPTAPPSQTPPPPISADPVQRWEDLTKGDPSTTAQGFGDGGSAGGYSGGGGLSAAPVGADAGRGPLQYGGSVGATEALTGNNPRPAVPAAGMAASAGGAGGGTGMGGGMPMGGAMGGGQGGEGGADHRRRYPYDGEDPFLLDQKASPPVIGL
ncbi:PPE domain-containing protein [Actinokineospora cianjurensis]|uniref:PPE family protein n=1 Tax=Actinokineospora cianjurensis TaxID=585224 RepID=A0A421AXV9_9PSEU|nr:PPE domain-containing protein [Actinokineospora cianjurensis]RLK54660.1 PPE family protein [Actinokineospora cianjurensis]